MTWERVSLRMRRSIAGKILALTQPLPRGVFSDLGLASGGNDQRRLEQRHEGAVMAGGESVEVISVVVAVSGDQRVLAMFAHHN